MKKVFVVFFLVLFAACVDEIEETYKQALKDFNEFRGTDFNPELEVVDTDFVLKHWGGYSESESLFYKAMMILPANYSFKKAKEHDLRSFVAFVWEGKIYVVKENFDKETFKRTVYHELEHLYQNRFNISSDGTFDGEKAKAAAIEGDARLIARILAKEPLEKERIMEINEDNAYFVLSSLHYALGYNLALEVYNRTGDTVYLLQNPPKTTEQILHPEKYFKNESFLNLDGEDRLGELFLFVFLATHTLDSSARIAAEGWNGDAYTINESGWIWKIAFDSEKDAEEFEIAVNLMLTKVGEKEGDVYVVKEKYLPQTIKVERKNEIVILRSKFLED